MTIQHDGQESHPIPDPTILTTEQLLREINNLRDLLLLRVVGLEDKITAQFDAYDRAITLIQSKADKVPSEVDLKTGALKDLLNEKFEAVSMQFKERDTRTQETASLNKLAIDAALQAQKEAAGKSEEGFTKQIDKLDELINTKTVALGTEIRANLAALDQKNTSNKERLDRIEGQVNGKMEQNSDNHTSNVFLVSIIGIAIAFAGLAITLGVLLHK